MATLTSVDLRSRLVLRPRDYQFDSADNLYDLNWLSVTARIGSQDPSGSAVQTRLATWELDAIALHCEKLANGQRAMWHPRFFDSGLHLWMRRSTDRSDHCVVMVILSEITGPLPVDQLDFWRDDRFHRPDGGLEGVRFRCTRSALAIFAEELRVAMARFPVRPLRKTG